MRRLLLVLMFLVVFALPAFAQTPTATPTAAFDFPSSPIVGQTVIGPSAQSFRWDGTKWVAQGGGGGGGGGGGFTPGGDLSGSATSQSVIGIQTKPVPTPASGYLHYSGTSFLWDTPTGTGGGIGEAPTDGNAYMRASSAWSSGGTLANDLTVSAVHLTNLSGWAPLNFGQPSLPAGTDGAVTASLFAYNKGVGGNNNLNITAGAHMWNGNWVSDTPTAEAIVMNPTSISFQYSTGNTVGATLGTWNNIAVLSATGIVLPNTRGGTAISFGSGTTPVGAISSGTLASLYLSAGAHSDGTNWIADAPAATIQTQENGGAQGYYFNSGLTVGSPFAPTELGWWSGNGLNLTAGHTYMINGQIQPNWVTGQGALSQCYGSTGFTVGAGATITVMHTGVWGASSMGFLSVWQSFSGAVSAHIYVINSWGSAGTTTFASLLGSDYGGGAAPFTLSVAGATDGGGNPYTDYNITNNTAQTTQIQYWYTPVGGGPMYCNF